MPQQPNAIFSADDSTRPPRFNNVNVGQSGVPEAGIEPTYHDIVVCSIIELFENKLGA